MMWRLHDRPHYTSRYSACTALLYDAIGVVFLASATLKSASPASAVASITTLIGQDMARPALGMLLLIEWAIGVWIVSRARPVLALVVVALIMAMSILALITLKHSGYQGSCGCFGSLIQFSLNTSLGISGTILLLCGILLCLDAGHTRAVARRTGVVS